MFFLSSFLALCCCHAHKSTLKPSLSYSRAASFSPSPHFFSLSLSLSSTPLASGDAVALSLFTVYIKSAWDETAHLAERTVQAFSRGQVGSQTQTQAVKITYRQCLCLSECQQRQYEDAGILKLCTAKTSRMENVSKGFSRNEGEIR